MEKLILPAVLTVTLAACGGSSDSSNLPSASPTVQNDSPEPTTVIGSNPAPAVMETQPQPVAGECIDQTPVGDGIGFNGVSECPLPITQTSTEQPIAGECIDQIPLNDGIGFNGVSECPLPITQTSTEQPIAGECIDQIPLNDGIGFNGVSECSLPITQAPAAQAMAGQCIDTAPLGDGIGNDGFITCRVPTASDPSWEFCVSDSSFNFDSELEFGQTWGSQQSRYNSGFTSNACVRRCGASAFALPDTPGWSYDPDAGAECIVDEDTIASFRETTKVPVYDINSSTTERQQFEDQFAYPLYYADASWNCSRETRASNNEEFTTEGSVRSFTFDKSANSENSFRDNWYFDRREWKQTLTIDDNSNPDEPFEYTGYAQIEHNSLTIYETSNDRLSCERSGSAPDLDLPTTISEFQNSENLLLDDLLNQTFQCQLLESLGRSQNTPSDIGWRTNSVELSSFDTVLTFNPTFLSIDDSGERRYQSTQGYLFSDRGQQLRISPAFSSLKYRDGRFYDRDSGTSSSYDHLLAKRIGNNVILEKHDFVRISGGGSDNFSYYICPVGG